MRALGSKLSLFAINFHSFSSRRRGLSWNQSSSVWPRCSQLRLFVLKQVVLCRKIIFVKFTLKQFVIILYWNSFLAYLFVCQSFRGRARVYEVVLFYFNISFCKFVWVTNKYDWQFELGIIKQKRRNLFKVTTKHVLMCAVCVCGIKHDNKNAL